MNEASQCQVAGAWKVSKLYYKMDGRIRGTCNDNTRGSIYDTSITRIVRYSAIYFLSHPTPEQIREMGRGGRSINDLIRSPRPFIDTSVCTYHSLGG
jgi:hypothetical protein